MSDSAYDCSTKDLGAVTWRGTGVSLPYNATNIVKQLLRSLSIKQGKKFDNPLSAREIKSFIDFHQLDMDEVLLTVDEFKTYTVLQIN